ncbi:hypothetical protein ER308_12710 [Egibacter rhizosphaerae]|uniref:Uncharacterized protein n=1 Tax=Egibacter rhizosphaerae TaxID=1670831 RepID=A0A411YGS0_9ACTN|nr:hypothetical protein [Egibacter rhizosphaerae]QBI20341.1 hypothetical protein ER308_12710 [Egibacter rhizosphaerae]
MLDALSPLSQMPFAEHLGVLLAKAELVPPDDWRAQAALPVGILFLLGGVFMLLRSNLGTRRAYLLQASCFFGFMVFMGAFWAFGVPGSAQYAGPTSLPGQPPGFMEPDWVAFAPDSQVAEMPEYEVVQDFPEGFQPVPADFEGQWDASADEGVDEIINFFATEEAGELTEATWADDPEFTTAVAMAENDRPIVAAQVREIDEDTGEADPEGDSYFAFAFYDPGSPGLPAQMIILLGLIGFVLHVLLLGWDEREERRRRERDLADEEAEDADERVPTPA